MASVSHWAAWIFSVGEGTIGMIVNFILMVMLICTEKRGVEKLYRIPIYVSSVQGFVLCSLIAGNGYAHLMNGGTFFIPTIGPLVHYASIEFLNLCVLVALFGIAMMWTLIPTTSVLQFLFLTRSNWSSRKKLFFSFLFVIITQCYMMPVIPDIIPSDQFREFIIATAREVYKINNDVEITAYGITFSQAAMNNNRSMIRLSLIYVFIPYCSAYTLFLTLVYLIRQRLLLFGSGFSMRTLKMQRAFAVMQILQGLLPLAILSIPVSMFLGASFLQLNLHLFSLTLTCFVWMCPIVQASVQLRFLFQSSSHSRFMRKPSKVTTLSSSHV